MTKTEQLRELYKKNGLEKEDVFMFSRGGKEIPIVTRTGIEKIQAHNGIFVTYKLEYFSTDLKTAIIKAEGQMIGENFPVKIETYGEVSPENNKNAYPIAMAEKRALSRAVLKLAGLYSMGVFGEDEAEDFKKQNLNENNDAKENARIKEWLQKANNIDELEILESRLVTDEHKELYRVRSLILTGKK